ncbi:hypothetical protein KR054_007000 [Drosophila jambulina]|nr:hypothetical protein KR054_007000 [Drosophila jambulina]
MNILSQTLLVLLPAIALARLCDVPLSQTNLVPRTNLYRSQKKFAVSMLDAIRRQTPTGNVFFSPYSTYNALLLAYFGSSGETEKELARVLQLDWASSKEMVRSAYVVEKKQIASRLRRYPLEFSSVGRIFYAKDLELEECLMDRLFDEYAQVNFHGQPDESRKEINAWIANQTHNQIRDMLTEEDITSRTRVVLADAAYLKGQWVSKFKVEKTSQERFHTTASEFSMVPMMKQNGTFLLTLDEHLDAKVLQMPFRTSYETKGNPKSDISMVLILPSTSLDNVVAKLNSEALQQAFNFAMPRQLELSVPKFEFEQRLQLVPILSAMGLTKTFTPTGTFQDLTSERIVFDDVQQVAKIKVDEEGSTAAAATILFSSRSARPVESEKFECNHPFLFLIYDETNESILFTGIYRKPKAMQV